MAKLTSYISTIFVVLVFISAAPALISNIKEQYKTMLEPSIKVGCVKFEGAICEADSYVKQLKKYFEDKEVKAILFEIESPGGGAGVTESIINEINHLKKKNPKPIVALTNTMCASGGYYIASIADHIIAAPSSIIGSIGAKLGFFNYGELLKKVYIKQIEKHSGAYKTIINQFGETDPKHELLLQEISDDCYKLFYTSIANNRKLSLKKLDAWGDGKVFTGNMAKSIGLVDELGSKINAEQKIRELALIKEEEKIAWVKEKEPSAITKWFEGKAQANLSAESIVDALFSKLESSFIRCN